MHQLDKYQGTHSPDSPDVIDAEYRVINPHPQIRLAALKLLVIAPVLALLAGGLCNLWSIHTAILATLGYGCSLSVVHIALDRARQQPMGGTLAALVLLTVIIATTGCSKQPDHNQAAAEKRATLEQFAPEVERLKKNPDAFKQAVEQCGRANDARIKAGQLGSNKDYRCAAIAQAYYTQHSKGAVFQGGSLDDNRK